MQVVSVVPLETAYIAQTASLLASSFSEALHQPSYRKFLVRSITSYLDEHLKTNACAILVALLEPEPAPDEASPDWARPASAESSESSDAAPSGKPAAPDYTHGAVPGSYDIRPEHSTGRRTVVATTELSFSKMTRSVGLTLNPPADAIYLCNLAVAPEHRRRGIATEILRVAEERARQHNPMGRIYLHTRVQDDPANALYQCASVVPSLKGRKALTRLIASCGGGRNLCMRAPSPTLSPQPSGSTATLLSRRTCLLCGSGGRRGGI